MRSLVLVGAGHVHLGVLARFARHPVPGTAITVVDPAEEGAYSGMLPPALAGRHPLGSASIAGPAVARAAGATWTTGRAVRIDEAGRWVVLADGTTIAADVVSLDVGARPAADGITGAEHLAGVRPMRAARALEARLDALGPDDAVVVVGAGAAGIELAVATAVRRRRSGARGTVTIVDAADVAVQGWPAAARRYVHDALDTHGIALRLGRTVRAVAPTHVVLGDDVRLDAALTIWAGGAAPHPLGLPDGAARSPRGFPLVDAMLRVPGTRTVHGGGDGVDHAAHPALEKSGVHAVQQAATLAHNLRVACTGTGAAMPWTPRSRTLALLDAGDGTAIARWGGWSARGRIMLALKRRLDHRYVAALAARAAAVSAP